MKAGRERSGVRYRWSQVKSLNRVTGGYVFNFFDHLNDKCLDPILCLNGTLRIPSVKMSELKNIRKRMSCTESVAREDEQ